MNREKVIRECIRQGGTPFYLFDLDTFTERIQRIRECLGERISLCYAMKANPFLISSAVSQVERLEGGSPGEFSICMDHKIPAEKLVVSGVYKEESATKNALAYGGAKSIYTVESLGQLQLLEKEAEKGNSRIPVLLRLTSGNQFGMEEEVIREPIREREHFPHLEIRGLQYYSGTQKKRRKVLEEELGRLDGLLKEWKEQYSFEAKELEYGPGFYVPYFQKEEEDELSETMRAFRELVEGLDFQGKITLEIGRYLAADCGIYVTRIVDAKENAGQKYGIVDGGIHHLNYFGQTMAMKIPHFVQLDGESLEEKKEGKENPVTICGALCTVSDVLVKNLPLRGSYLGDVLVFERTGAYSVTEGIYLFLSRNFPRIFSFSREQGVTLVRDEIASSQFNGGSQF